jgi:hypothetical protein
MTAQIASILASTISWVWWPLFVLSAPIVAVLQTTWCCKMKKAGMIAACVLSFLAFAGALFIAVWMTTQCWNGIFVVLQKDDDDGYVPYDDSYSWRNCRNYMANPTAWVVVAYVDCALFLLTFVAASYFTYARYDAKVAKWAHADDEADADEVVVPVLEMGVMHSTPWAATATMVSPDEKTLDQA